MALNVYVEVVKVMNYMGLWDTELSLLDLPLWLRAQPQNLIVDLPDLVYKPNKISLTI